jgi:probable HAF family extracellular repeat protein
VRALTPTTIQPSSPCAISGASGASVNNVQAILNEALGDLQAVDDPNGDGVSNVVDVQVVANAAIGKGCSVPNQFPAIFPLLPPSQSFAKRVRTAIDLGAADNLSPAAYGFKRERPIAGQAIGAHRFFHDGTSTELGTLGGANSEALDFNRNGQVVGWAATADGARHAFLWTAGTMVDVNAFGSAGDGVVFVRAVAIDETGRILAHGSNGHAYLVSVPITMAVR